MRKSSKFLVVLLFALILAVGTYAYAAANNVDTSAAGDGQAAISGFAITNVHYTLNGTDPGSIDSVSFDINPAVTMATVVKVKLVDTGTTWYTCTATVGTAVACPTTGASVLAADMLRVIAAH